MISEKTRCEKIEKHLKDICPDKKCQACGNTDWIAIEDTSLVAKFFLDFGPNGKGVFAPVQCQGCGCIIVFSAAAVGIDPNEVAVGIVRSTGG